MKEQLQGGKAREGVVRKLLEDEVETYRKRNLWWRLWWKPHLKVLISRHYHNGNDYHPLMKPGLEGRPNGSLKELRHC